MNLIWDFDGTIYNSYPRILNAFDMVVNKKYQHNVALTRLEDLIYVDTKVCAKAIATDFGHEYEALLKEIRDYYDMNGQPEAVFPSAKKILLQTHRHRHYLVTHRDRQSLLRNLGLTGIGTCFEEIISKDDGFAEKPSCEAFEYLIQKYSLDRSKTLAIGDRDIDMLAGRGARIRTILLSTRSGIDADHQIASAEQLPALLDQIA